jgi:hypothetical protein
MSRRGLYTAVEPVGASEVETERRKRCSHASNPVDQTISSARGRSRGARPAPRKRPTKVEHRLLQVFEMSREHGGQLCGMVQIDRNLILSV